MGETVLVRADLTPRLIEAGRALVAGLDSHGFAFEAAFWLLDEESGIWNLFLSSRAIKMEGGRAQYAEVHKVILAMRLQKDIPIYTVAIVGDRTPLVRALRGALGMTGSVDGTRLGDTYLDRIRIPACVLYRLSARQKLQPVTSEVRT